jgi:YbgC/YbaW family acyl-CoA thioester hydrolase
MNLWLRLLWLMVVGRFRSRVDPLGPCRTPFRVWPSDLDVFMHVNNGVYLSMMDLARVDLMARSGLLAKIRARGWHPVVTSQTIQYRRSLRLLEQFEIVTRVLAWDDKYILLQQEFERRGEVVATALMRGRFRSREGNVAMTEIVALAGNPAPPANVSDFARQWNATQSSWQGSQGGG